MPRRLLSIALALLAIGLIPGCVERTITITSHPSGALVHLNDEEVGRTPLTVPFTFYGTYDVRLERDADWFGLDEAQQLLGVSSEDLSEAILAGQAITRQADDGSTQVRLSFQPLWTTGKATAPFWEYPGPDLIGEAIPGNKVNIAWHYTLEPRTETDEDALLDRAGQMRATLPPDVDEASGQE